MSSPSAGRQQQRSLFFDVQRPEAQRHLGIDPAAAGFLLAFKRNLPFPAIEGGKDQEGGLAFRINIKNVALLRIIYIHRVIRLLLWLSDHHKEVVMI